MGGKSSSSTTQSSSLTPYAGAAGSMDKLLAGINNLSGSAGSLTTGQQSQIDKVIGLANGQPDYSQQINNGTLGLLNGGGAQSNDAAIKSNLGLLQNGFLGQTANGANIGNNTALKAQLDTIGTDVSNNINSAWAAAGRDGSPGNAQAVARGVAQAQAPILAAQFNTDTANALNAANTLYNAGNTTYGLLNGTQGAANSNFAAGVGSVSEGIKSQLAAPEAAMQALSQQFNIPASQLTTLLGAVSPVAAQFGTNNAQSNTENQMSGAQQFALLANGLSSLGGAKSSFFGA